MFTIESLRAGRVAVLRIGGRIDGATAKPFRKEISKSINYNCDGLILDMESLEYLSSAGIREIFLVGKKVRKRKLKFALCSLQEGVRGVFRVMGFDQLMDIYPSRKEALLAEFKK